jgi:hypothetical protein
MVTAKNSFNAAQAVIAIRAISATRAKIDRDTRAGIRVARPIIAVAAFNRIISRRAG